MPPERVVTARRSLVKALTYRAFAFCLDFVVIYLFTHKVDLALGFIVLSNFYRTTVYFFHERLWAPIRWGTEVKST
jgi:uncharacterized membrane protein